MDEVKIQTKFATFLVRKYLEGKIKKMSGRSLDIGALDISVQHEAGNKVKANVSFAASMTESEFGALIEQLIGG